MGDPRFLIRSVSPILNCTDQMIKQWRGETFPLNLGVWISRLGIEAVGHLVFGIKLGSLDGESSPMIGGSLKTKDLVKCVRGMLDTIQEYIYVPLPSYFFSIVKTKSIR